MNNHQDTICAIATGNGVGAISIIRVSGKDALANVSVCFSKDLSSKDSHTIHFGTFRSPSGDLIDEVLISIFHEGKSFTGEESAEISCHGSPYIQQQILDTLLHSGCRLATPGEFTMRAFMNGKMDLSQAEAVADLIAAQTKNAHDIALNQMRGSFSSELKALREKLIHFASLIELELDFAEEDVEFADRTQLKILVDEVLRYLHRLEASFALGNAIKNGVPVAIVGAPNTGKSSLLNQLIGEERAIVSNIAGTTRDVIEETLNIDGMLFRFIDTAGIREGAEEIEAMGIERSREKILQAKIVLCLSDGSDLESITSVAQWVRELRDFHPDKIVLQLCNKSDISEKTTESCDKDALWLSARTGEGVDQLRSILTYTIAGDFSLADETIVTNARHVDALRRTISSLEKAQADLDMQITADFIAMDIRQAMFDLGTITGDISTDDLLGNIFAKFCIGK
jgi:tRNA modification GTPase